MTEWKATVIYMGVFLVIIFLDAIGDALRDEVKFHHNRRDSMAGNYTTVWSSLYGHLAGALKSLLLGFFILCICLFDSPATLWAVSYKGAIWLLIGYVWLRYALYYMVYYMTRGMVPFHGGETYMVRKVLRWWFKKTGINPALWFFGTRLIAFIFGLYAIAEGIV